MGYRDLAAKLAFSGITKIAGDAAKRINYRHMSAVASYNVNTDTTTRTEIIGEIAAVELKVSRDEDDFQQARADDKHILISRLDLIQAGLPEDPEDGDTVEFVNYPGVIWEVVRIRRDPVSAHYKLSIRVPG